MAVVTDVAQFVRYQAVFPNDRGTYPGVFALTNGLAHAGALSAPDRAWWRVANDWCNDAYPDPSAIDPSVYDRTVHSTAQAWFKSTALHLLAMVDEYVALLHRYGVPCEQIRTNDPGEILYEDEVQVVAVPR